MEGIVQQFGANKSASTLLVLFIPSHERTLGFGSIKPTGWTKHFEFLANVSVVRLHFPKVAEFGATTPEKACWFSMNPL